MGALTQAPGFNRSNEMEAKKFAVAKKDAHTIPTFGIEIHPDANTVRMMTDEEYVALRDDIEKNGQLVPATICQGKLLDGRNRLKACHELGVGLWVENAGDSDVDTVAMVYSLNVTRRHLNTAERAFMGADMANLENGARDGFRGNQYQKGGEVKSKMDSTKQSRKYTRHEAAAVVECSPQDITAARNVRKYAPELEEKAKRGEIHIREAEKQAKKKALKTGKIEEKKKPQEKVVPITPATKISGDSASWDDLLFAIDFKTELISAAAADIMHPQHMVARRLSENRDRIIGAMSPLNKPDRKRSLQAVVSVFQYEQEVFNAELKAMMPKYNRELEKRLKAEIDEQKKITADLRKKIGAGFSKADFKFIRGVLHSDRDVDKSRMDKAFDLFMKLEPIFN